VAPNLQSSAVFTRLVSMVCNLTSLAWTDDTQPTAVNYVAMHCPCWRTTGPAVQLTVIPLPQSAALQTFTLAFTLH